MITTNISEDLKKICQLRVVQYSYIDTVTKGNRPKYGFLAQEVEKIMPDVVHKNQDFIPNVYEKATSLHVDSIKNQLTVQLKNRMDLKTEI